MFGVTGTGRVSQGILEILKRLPHIFVEPDNLKNYLEETKNDPKRTKKIVISVFASKFLVKRKDGSEF